MDPRRAFVVILLVLAVSAIAASLAPPQRGAGLRGGGGSGTSSSPGAPAGPSGGGQATQVRFDAAAKAPRTRTVKVGQHVILTVKVPAPGEVSLGGLGQVAAADPQTPAVFDLLLDRPGHYPVRFMPADGHSRGVGTLVVNVDAPALGQRTSPHELVAEPCAARRSATT